MAGQALPRRAAEPDRASYTPGGTATIRVTSPFAGKALITVERERILRVFVRDIPEGVSEVSIPIGKEYIPNVYVTAQVIRSPEGLDRHASVKAFGTVSIPIDASGNKLDVTVSAPEVIRPGGPFTVEIQVGHGPVARQVPGSYNSRRWIFARSRAMTSLALDFFYGKKRLSYPHTISTACFFPSRADCGPSSPAETCPNSPLLRAERHLIRSAPGE